MFAERSLWRHFDIPLLVAVLALCGLGVAMTYSATINTIDVNHYWIRQLQFVGIGTVVLFFFAALDYRHLELVAQPMYGFLLGLLLMVELFGADRYGAQRWLDIGPIVMQPTEIGKFFLIIFFAWYLSRFQSRLRKFGYLIAAIVLLALPLALIYLQPDLGMTITFAFIGGALILLSGVRLWHLTIMGGAGLAALPFLWGTMQGYMIERIQIYLNPASDPDAAFNVQQALISVGNGGWWGMGWNQGSQNKLHFLRVRQSDFVFSVIAEEFGFLGTILILVLIFFVIWRVVRIADLAQDQFGRLVAIGIAALIFFQSFINIGMNLSLVPVTGMTLPFVSYGGSSLVSMMLAIGLVQSIVMRHRKIDFM